MNDNHACLWVPVCSCYQLALEPNEHCEKHGWDFRKRCFECGRFMKDASLQTDGDDEYGLAKAYEQVADSMPPGWKF